MTLRELRESAGRSRAWVAVMAGVSEPTVRVYEIDETQVAPSKRAAIAPIYDDFKRQLAHGGA